MGHVANDTSTQAGMQMHVLDGGWRWGRNAYLWRCLHCMHVHGTLIGSWPAWSCLQSVDPGCKVESFGKDKEAAAHPSKTHALMLVKKSLVCMSTYVNAHDALNF